MQLVSAHAAVEVDRSSVAKNAAQYDKADDYTEIENALRSAVLRSTQQARKKSHPFN